MNQLDPTVGFPNLQINELAYGFLESFFYGFRIATKPTA